MKKDATGRPVSLFLLERALVCSFGTKDSVQKLSGYWERRNLAKDYYSGIKKTPCPVLGDEEIVFSTLGFSHLIRKGGALRSKSDQIRRFNLLKYAVPIISDPLASLFYYKESGAEFWSLSKNINGKHIKVIIRRFPGGNSHFFSVMDRS